MSGIKPPEFLLPNDITLKDFELWYEAFIDYVTITQDASKLDDQRYRSLFLAIGGLEIRRIVNGLTLADNKFNTLVDAVKKYFQPVKNVILERHRFFHIQRGHDEDLSAFLVRLKAQAELCEFDDISIQSTRKQMIRDQYLRCVNDKKITEYLLTFNNLTLEDVVEKAEGLAQAQKDADSFSKTNENDQLLTFNVKKSVSTKYENTKCFRCNGFGHISRFCKARSQRCISCNSPNHDTSNCFKNKKCSNCLKFGHTENFCRRSRSKDRSVNRQQIHYRSESRGVNLRHKQNHAYKKDNDQNRVLFIDKETCNGTLKYANVTFDGGKGSFLVDTGASFSVISNSLVKKFSLENSLSDCNFNGITADKSTVLITKCFKCDLTIENMSFKVVLYVMDTRVDGILGMDLLPKIGLHIGGGSCIICTLVPDILRRYSQVFDCPLKESYVKGIQPFEIIKLEKDAVPKQSGPLKLSKAHQDFLIKHIDFLLENDIIEESHSAWRHNPRIVNKSDGTYRMTINYKPVNACTKFDAFPFANVESMLNKLSGAKIFSRIDFSQFYHQLPLVESDREKTAFQACGRLYHFKKCPFGLKNAVAYCSRLMAEIFKGIDNIIVYLDDVLIYGRDKEQHDKTLESVLQRVKDHNLSLNMRKCEFEKRSTVFLGHLIEDGAVRPDPDRLKPLHDFPLPKSSAQLQRFLGLATYYSKYVQNFSGCAKILYDKLNDFGDWSPMEVQAFDSIKSQIANSLLTIPDPNEPLFLRTDACQDAIAAILETKDHRPVYFCSRMLNASERTKDIVELEALAIFWGIMRCKSFLLGRHFKVISDHRPLQYLLNNENCSNKLARWRMQLQEFDFEVQHCKGKDNLAADCLSRLTAIEVEGMSIIRNQQVIAAQKFDAETQSMITALQRSYRRKPGNVSDRLWKLKNYLMVDDQLLKTKSQRTFVPYSLRLKVLTLGHGCHCGRTQTLERIRSCFFWPNLTNEVSDFVNKCRTCSLVKPKFVHPESAPMLTKSPMETIATDFVGPLPSCNGYRYLLVIIDVFSRYPMIFPMRDMTVSSVIKQFGHFFSLFGFPDAVLSDRGSQFESKEFIDYLRSYGIKKLRTNAFHASGNGICERFHKTIKKSMIACLDEHSLSSNQWVSTLNSCLLEYRTSVHASTKHRPADLFFAFNVHGFLPNSTRSTSNSFANNIRSQIKNKMQVDKTHQNRNFQPGETVLVHNIGKPKFGLKGDLAKVIRQYDFHSVEIQFLNGGRVTRCNAGRLSHVNDDLIHESHEYKYNSDCSAGTSDTSERTSSPSRSCSRSPSPNRRSPSPDRRSTRRVTFSDERPTRDCGPPQFYGDPVFH